MVPIRGMVRIYLESEQRAALKWRCKLALHKLPPCRSRHIEVGVKNCRAGSLGALPAQR